MEKLAQTNIVAGVVIKQDGKYLLAQENRPGTKVHGLWNFPAGKVEEGATIEKTAVKEAKEEIGYNVELIRKLGIFQANTKTPQNMLLRQRSLVENLIGRRTKSWIQNGLLGKKFKI
ncbi:MAG: NUDIX domain-containing protein [bacterium]|nr:NUDIX domain-containing protein [bacterium]